MLETICPKCGARYPLGADHTCRKATKSTAARKDVPVVSPHRKSPSQGRVSELAVSAGGKSVAPADTLPAGTQALPVDTVKRRGRPISPNPKSKRAAYQRELMRERRAKAKAP